MVVASPTPVRHERVRTLGVPVVDLSQKRGRAAELIVRACEEFGFFKVINHGVPAEMVATMEAEAATFFALPTSEKQKAGPPSPLGYGSKNIGFNGDTGEVEYLLLHANPVAIAQRARAVCRRDPARFSCAVGEYVGAARELACTILEMLGEGLHLRNTGAIAGLVRDTESDSLLRLNHYPSCDGGDDKESEEEKENRDASNHHGCCRRKGSGVGGGGGRVGFGEHTDPQVITLLRSNDAPGLQVLSPPDGGGDGCGVWVPVPPDPAAFFVNVGDVLQALTNGRFVSVRHRAVVSSFKPRLSVVYFAAPPLHARISPLSEMVAPQRPCLYRSFTWGEYKKAMYSLRLAHNRLELFRQHPVAEQGDEQQHHLMN
ncbi:hypothetical protein Taro_042796 [Colocasia esculenta]|uniref:gibberellin 2beta-dioxygenase n=1 Tax=Colocasia esculenta TaxID=4460 RepID=A0A843WHT2_COLES|nr:hypothetical protein [Colocasia esculenta]